MSSVPWVCLFSSLSTVGVGGGACTSASEPMIDRASGRSMALGILDTGVRCRYYWKDLESVTTDTTGTHNAHSDSQSI
ncbi:hypothetical protein F5888DRAFT_1643198 [Russula emetica]|nr:hypothetical protein F5888DRAFT_1643198 [Russula emetica]